MQKASQELCVRYPSQFIKTKKFLAQRSSIAPVSLCFTARRRQ